MKKLMMVAVAALFVGAFAQAEGDAKAVDSKETTTSADGGSKTTEKHEHKGHNGAKMKSEKMTKHNAKGATKTETTTESAPADAPATK